MSCQELLNNSQRNSKVRVTFLLVYFFQQGTQCDTECLVRVGDIEISEEASLYDLKMQISTLPQVSGNVHDVFYMQS